MRCAKSLQSLNVHRSFFGGMPPRTGNVRVKVESGSRLNDDSVVDRVSGRCLPACVNRMEPTESEVRSESSWRRVGIEVCGGRARGIAGQDCQ